MAPPTKTVPHPGRALTVLVALIVIMLLSLLGSNLFSPGQWHKDFRIGLGLDLSSGTELSMKATTLSGGLPTNGDMQEAITIILARVNGTGNTGAEVQTEGANILNVSVPGKTVQQTANLVSETALLMFRQTLLFQAYTGTTPSASASASPTRNSVGLREFLRHREPVVPTLRHPRRHGHGEHLRQDRSGQRQSHREPVPRRPRPRPARRRRPAPPPRPARARAPRPRSAAPRSAIRAWCSPRCSRCSTS